MSRNGGSSTKKDEIMKWIGNYVVGILQCLVISVPVILASWTFFVFKSLGACMGECSGFGYLVIFGLYYAAAILPFVILLYVIIFLIVYKTWTGNPVQYLGALTIIPMILVAKLALGTLTVVVADAKVDRKYLERVNKNPTGKIAHLLLKDGPYYCGDCRLYLLNGFADVVSSVYVVDRSGTLKVKSSYRLVPYSQCGTRADTVYFQEAGIFDVCVIRDDSREIRSDAILVGNTRHEDPPVTRAGGLSTAAVAFEVANGKIGPEILRWESGLTQGSNTHHGTKFREPDFIRALTGITTGRKPELNAVTFKQRLELVKEQIGKMPLVPEYVTTFLDEARYKDMNPEDLKTTFRQICADSPRADFRQEFDPVRNNCIRHYNRWVQQIWPVMKDRTMLPEPGS